MRVDWTAYRPRITVTGMRQQSPDHPYWDWRAALAEHDILFVTSGRGSLRVPGQRTIPLAPGTCLWLTPGRIYEGHQDSEDLIRNYYIHFELLDAAGRLRSYDQPVPPEQIDRIDTAAVEAMFRRITTLLPYFTTEHRAGYAPERVMVAELLLHALLTELDLASQDRLPEAGFGLRRHHEEAVVRVLTELQEQGDEPVTVRSMADSAGYSAAHFSRIFRAIVGQWPEQFVIERRLERAKVLLTTTAMSIGEIAAQLGYRQTSFFSTQFSNKVGCSPRVFRERRRKSEASTDA